MVIDFTEEEINIVYDYVVDMLILFKEDSCFYNNTYDIKFTENDFLLLKNKLDIIKS